jgi:dihydropyrimidinase
MSVDLVVSNGRVVTPAGVIPGGVTIDGERIVAVGADSSLPPARRRIDAREQYVLPGLIDAHVHMGSEEDASIAEALAQNMPAETDGAIHGGITTFAHFVGQRNEPLIPNIEITISAGWLARPSCGAA